MLKYTPPCTGINYKYNLLHSTFSIHRFPVITYWDFLHHISLSARVSLLMIYVCRADPALYFDTRIKQTYWPQIGPFPVQGHIMLGLQWKWTCVVRNGLQFIHTKNQYLKDDYIKCHSFMLTMLLFCLRNRPPQQRYFGCR